MAYFFVLLFAGLSAGFVLAGLGFSRIVAPHHPGRIKNMPYECGEQPIGQAWVQYNVGYYLFGLLFLVFDVEAAFLYPWATTFRQLGQGAWVAFLEVILFVIILVVALVYAWKKGVLEWV